MTNRKVLAGILAALMLFLAGCTTQTIQAGIISPKDALKMMEQDEKAILLDVRTPEEYREKRIPGSVLVPDYDIRDKIAGVVPDKGTKIIVYCRSGRRSAAAVQTLNELGYKNVYDLGGIIDWPYDTTSGD